VIHVAEGAEGAHRRAAPEGLAKEYLYREKPISFSAIASYADCQDERLEALVLSEHQVDEYIQACESVFRGGPKHQLFGYAAPQQANEMDLESQLASHGLYCGNQSGYEDPRAKELENGRYEWVLLLQFDTDDDVGMMWGDAGTLYFWIRKEDLAAARFDRCWMILQCG
jgi:uncharacterized protein YwqG